MTVNNGPVLHAAARQQRLIAANNEQAQDILRLVAALREVYAILSDRSSERTERERIDLSRKHIVSALARHGTMQTGAKDQFADILSVNKDEISAVEKNR